MAVTPGGDKMLVPFNVVPLDQLLEALDTQNDGQAGQNATVTTTRTFKPLELEPVQKKSSQSIFFDRLNRIEVRTDNAYRKQFISLLSRQEKEIIAIIQQKYKMVSKSVEEDIDAALEAGSVVWAKKLLKILLPAYEDAGSLALVYVGPPDAAFVLEQATRDAIYDSTQRLMDTFGKETGLDIRRQLNIGLENRESVEELTKRIEEVYDQAKGYRATRIAQTESHHAINTATKEGYAQGGVTQIVWKTDGNPCEFCAAMDGTVVSIDEPFLSLGDEVTGASGKSYSVDYQDVEAADLHPNCMCSLVPVTDGSFSIGHKKMLIKVHEQDPEAEQLRKALEESETFNKQLLDTLGVEYEQ